VGRTYRDSDPAGFPQPVQAPKGAPNIVLIMLDDVGFGQFSTFGGGVPSPTMDRLAAEGLRYKPFPHDIDLQPDPCRAAHRSQCTFRFIGHDYRSGDGLRWLHQRAAAQHRCRRRSLAARTAT
jgi:hypothetical protein